MPNQSGARRSDRDKVWSDQQDRRAFLWFFGVGVFLILVLKALDTPQFLVTLAPCALMGAYAYVIWDPSERRPRLGATGDNLYYLGFLYTLTSLAHSLYRFSPSEADAENIVTNFGIAVSTTILGMALRVLMAPPDDDLETIDRETRLDLAAASRRLRAELTYSAETFRETVEQDLKGFKDLIGDVRGELAGDLSDLRQKLAADADRTQEITLRTVRRSVKVDHALKVFESGARGTGTALLAHARALERRSKSLDSVDQSLQQLHARTDRVVEAMEEHAAGLAAGASRVREALLDEARSIREVDFRPVLERALDPAARALGQVLEEFKTAVERLQAADASREQAALSSQQATQALRDALERQQYVAAGVLEVYDRSREVSRSVHLAGEQIADFSEKAKDAVAHIVALRDGLLQSAEHIRIVNEQVSRASTALERGVRATEQREKRVGPPGLVEWFARREREQGYRSLPNQLLVLLIEWFAGQERGRGRGPG